jgi:eukaryotic-like serine/threonine-protein kinase
MSVQLIRELPSDALGPYRLLRPIGKGGIGQVFAAVHEHLGRPVALKVLWPDSAEAPQLVARFLQEGRTLEQLRHPGIVRVYDCAKLENGTAYLAMEHLQGDTLRVWMHQKSAPASLEAALAITFQIAEAMVEVHEKGIVHRDLKPENVILTPDDTATLGFRPTVVDFGIAKVPPSRDDEQGDTHVKTAAYDVLGTPAYMAPEQCKNVLAVTDRADVYALGCVLFELIAGKPPFESTDKVELVYHHVKSTPPQLRERVPAVPPLLSAFVASMLAKSPEERPTMSRCRDMLARPWKIEATECPLPGLQPFSEAQAELFFGRETETHELVAMLTEMREGENRRWLQIEGPSGAGKSSLVQAGILPELVGKPWIVAVLRPSEDPIRSLAQALLTACAEHGLSKPPSEIESAMRSDRGALVAILEQHTPPSAALLLVIEQLEELFALGGVHREQFDALLSRAMTSPASPLRLLTTLRSDYMHRLEQTPEMARLLNGKAARYHLHPMREEALAQVIRGMAARAGLRLSEDLAERMVRDAAGAEGRLPLLGHTLRSLWSARSGVELTHHQYEQMGGVGGALARQAALLLDGLGEAGRERAKWLILDLVQVGRGAPDTRRPRTHGEALKAAGGDAKAEEVLARLSGMPLGPSTDTAGPLRLVVVSEDAGDAAQQRVDLVHETLLQRVPIIVGWIDAERALLERHAELEVAAHVWDQSGRPNAGLPSGPMLGHYRFDAGDARQKARLLDMASERARSFIDSAVRLEQRGLRLWRALSAALVIAVLVTSISALIARRERERAEANLMAFLRATSSVPEADWEFGRLPHTLNVRRKMLEATDQAQSFLRDREPSQVRNALAWTKHRRSDLARQNDTLSIAGDFIAEARGLIDAGLKDEPSSRELRLLLALNISKQGKLTLARGLHKEALAEFTASVAELEAMGDDGTPDYRRTLATSYAEQGDAELALEHFAVAENLYDKSARLLDQNGETKSGYDRALFASTRALQAEAARKNGDLHGAAAYLDRAKDIQEKLSQAQPGNMLYQMFLGSIYASLAALHDEEGQPEEAARLYDLAIKIGEDLHQGDRTQKEYGLLLCQSLKGAEDAARAQVDTQRTERMKAQRCDVARQFVEQDSEDSRFKELACP